VLVAFQQTDGTASGMPTPAMRSGPMLDYTTRTTAPAERNAFHAALRVHTVQTTWCNGWACRFHVRFEHLELVAVLGIPQNDLCVVRSGQKMIPTNTYVAGTLDAIYLRSAAHTAHARSCLRRLPGGQPRKQGPAGAECERYPSGL
jgi:hypothetical protein